jgi:formate C-acetyltransferase
MKFNPLILSNEQGIRNFVALIRTYCDLGGWHIQFNIINESMLKDAQKHPEKYPSLIVRVAGYSAYFNDLCNEVQNDIISRIEHNLH